MLLVFQYPLLEQCALVLRLRPDLPLEYLLLRPSRVPRSQGQVHQVVRRVLDVVLVNLDARQADAAQSDRLWLVIQKVDKEAKDLYRASMVWLLL